MTRVEYLIGIAISVFIAAISYTAVVLHSPLPVKRLNGAIWMTVPQSYRQWYEETAQCAQLPNLDYHKIEWYVIPDVVTFPTDIGEKVALWEDIHDGWSRITIADFYVNNEMVVRHEMLHDLLNRYGRPTGHPALYFEERCGLTWSTWKGHTP